MSVVKNRDNPTNAHAFLGAFGKLAKSTREKGDSFERLTREWLRTVSPHKDRFHKVYLWGEFAETRNMDRTDTGIDLVAVTHEKEYCAIQCKFIQPSDDLDKDDIDSFFTKSGQRQGDIEFKERIIVSTTPKWSKHAENALKNQQIPCTRLDFATELGNASIDWDAVGKILPLYSPTDVESTDRRFASDQQTLPIDEIKDRVEVNFSELIKKLIPTKGKSAPHKRLRRHQKKALQDVMNGFKNADRGQLIMACGTGKTFTALKISEEMVADGGNILFLVPSLALLSQTLLEWSEQSQRPLRNFAVCSDTKVGKNIEDISVHDLAIPATTDSKKLADKLMARQSTMDNTSRTNVVFATYHSIDVIADAQKLGAPQFDFVVCDEAHRTTGAEDSGKEKTSPFTKIHNNDYLQVKKRLYMTATPRIYTESARTRASEFDIKIFSMDDVAQYGVEFHRLDFSDAVGAGLLSDYKVIILTVNESHISAAMQSEFATNGELNLNDTTKIIGCWNGLAKQFSNPEDVDGTDGMPMRRAVAFTQQIKASKQITQNFSDIVQDYIRRNPQEGALECEVRHVDGTQNALVRNRELQWLKSEPGDNKCHVLSNVRCLSEGVDVPALDAVMFLNPRKSQVDVVQSVGRVMRKAEGKEYGYIILPVGVSASERPEDALDKNDNYRVVWDVLQALRAHDNRFNAEINKIEINKGTGDRINVIGIGFDDKESDAVGGVTADEVLKQADLFDEWRGAIFAKMVVKCGDRRYWETWAKDIAAIAEANTTRINGLLENAKGDTKKRFADFLNGLKTNINPFINKEEAVEMLSQHLITKPVFNALFKDYDFAAKNPVSKTMQGMIDLLEKKNLGTETKSLERFYQSVRERAEGVDNAEGKQKIIIELYDKFFKTAFPKMAERLGIVYTPVEVIDFILQSVQDTMINEFGKDLSDEGVDILDPFTGTGSFIVRMLQGNYIQANDLQRKYRKESHANEIVLLAYYIAAINIEEAYHFRAGGDYEPFQGILLADTFQLGEQKGDMKDVFPENFARAETQNKRNIRVIVGNPPYSAGQRNENDANQNIEYPTLDQRITETYAEHSTAINRNSLYDSYIRSIRWASDRIGDEGIIAFVSNGSYIDGTAAAGVRKVLADEFSAIYCFNLRGNARTSGEIRRKEKDNVFGQGTRTAIAITLFVKNPMAKDKKCAIYYHDIGDYLTQKEKLGAIKDFTSVGNIEWEKITPNAEYDWINQRDPKFKAYMSLGNRDAALKDNPVFFAYKNGVGTSRDAFVYNFHYESLVENTKRTIGFYNDQVEEYKKTRPRPDVKDFIEKDQTKISWSSSLKSYLKQGVLVKFNKHIIRKAIYRPFNKQFFYADKYFVHRPAIINAFFPTHESENLAIYVSGVGAGKNFSALMVNIVPNMHFLDTGQCFPFYSYEKPKKGEIFDKSSNGRTENIPDATLTLFRDHYNDKKISKWDIFYYVYGLLHSPHYKTKYAADLKKMLPRIPMHKEFHTFSKAGKALGELHVNYEDAPEYPLTEIAMGSINQANREVVKMKFAKTGKETDKTAIVYNNHLVLQNIPPEAYDYVVNGRSAIEWVMDRYKKTTDKNSQIKNDPNQWSDDPNYIIKLLKKVVYVSVESVKIIESLPELEQ